MTLAYQNRWWNNSIFSESGGLRACLLNGPRNPVTQTRWFLRTGSEREGNKGRTVPIITEQLPSTETWPIKTVHRRHAHGHTHARRAYDVAAPSGHPSILIPLLEHRPNAIIWLGESIV